MKSVDYTILMPEEGNNSGNSSKPNYNAFISKLLSDPSTTKEDRERIVELLLKERDEKYVTKEQLDLFLKSIGVEKKAEKKSDGKTKVHNPRFTADFLSLFNRRNGFKYLTHNFDTSGNTLIGMITQVRSVFKNYSNSKELPESLRALMNRFINGGRWYDYEGKECVEGYSSKTWFDWSEQNNDMHPIMNTEGFEKTIQRFRHTIRLVAPDLQYFAESIKDKYPTFSFDFINLKKADFYTNVNVLRCSLLEIIKDLTDHQDYKNIKIEYRPDFDGDYFIRYIVIKQIDSYSLMPIDEVLEKFKSTGGFFSGNAEKLTGYCNWSVESIWDGKPYRWNILKENNVPEIEQISEQEVAGFTHILTFYYKA